MENPVDYVENLYLSRLFCLSLNGEPVESFRKILSSVFYQKADILRFAQIVNFGVL